MATAQLSLSFESALDRKFREFHEANPAVYRLLVRFAREAANKRKRVGIKALWERVRWESYLATDTADAFALNNSYTSRYARLLMDREPDLRGAFEVRGLKS